MHKNTSFRRCKYFHREAPSNMFDRILHKSHYPEDKSGHEKISKSQNHRYQKPRSFEVVAGTDFTGCTFQKHYFGECAFEDNTQFLLHTTFAQFEKQKKHVFAKSYPPRNM